MLENTHFLNVNKLAQNIGVSQPTTKNYIHYLESMMVVRRVPIFLKSLVRRLIKQPKIYVCDQPLVNECLGFNFSIQSSKIKTLHIQTSFDIIKNAMRKKIWANKAKSFKEGLEFDIKFWRRAGVRARFAATWKALDEFYKFKGKHGYKPRLRRSIQNIKQV